MSSTFPSDLTGMARALFLTVSLTTPALAVQAQGTAAPAATASSVAAPVSTEAGRELFDVHCARCHGAHAMGTANGPNLLPRVKGMSEQAFVSAVLQRYRFSVPAAESSGESGAREAMLRGLMSRQDASGGMPRWEEQPVVSQGVKSLYQYLAAKAR